MAELSIASSSALQGPQIQLVQCAMMGTCDHLRVLAHTAAVEFAKQEIDPTWRTYALALAQFANGQRLF